MIPVPPDVNDIASVQIDCVFAEIVPGEPKFQPAVL